MTRSPRSAALVGFLFMVFGFGFSAAAQEDALPYLRWEACPFDTPEDETGGETLYCGVLVTYEDHFSQENAAEVEIAFAILSGIKDAEPDAVIYLEGGPGVSALHEVDTWVESAVRTNRDLTLLDQRGTGFSLPSLICIEVETY